MGSVELGMKPAVHWVHVPLGPEQVEQLVEQDRQFPVESLKKPGAQSEHCVAAVVFVVVAMAVEIVVFAAEVVHPGEHAQTSLDPAHTPFSQLQVDVDCSKRHLPEPVAPSSQVLHPEGHAVH